MTEAAITAQLNTLIQALHTKDLDRLAHLYTPDVISFDIEPPLQHVGRAAKLKNWERVFAVFQDLSNGTRTPGMWVRATFCFKNVEGTWLIAHDQVSVPLEIHTGKGVTNLSP